MDWGQVEEILTRFLGPRISTIIITAIIALLLPILLHLFLYRSTKSTTFPTLLLVGPSGAGKTALLTLFECGFPSPTRTSQTPHTALCKLPEGTPAASRRYRSKNDTSNRESVKFLLRDTPGHGKLRHHAFEALAPPAELRGILFVVDAAAISASPSAGQAAAFLYDVLLALQRHYTRARTSRGPQAVPLCVLANKADLFTALPASLVRATLEQEIGKIRSSRASGLLDSGIEMDRTVVDGGEKELLGDANEDKFEFKQMEEYNVPVEVIGGNVMGGSAADVDGLWKWVGRLL